MLMAVLSYVLLTVEVLTCILLVGVILLQRTRSQGAGLAFGSGMGETLFGSQAGNVLTKTTVILAIVFLVNTTLLALLQVKRDVGYSGSVADKVRPPAAPAGLPAPMQPPQAPAGGEAAPAQPVWPAPMDLSTLPGSSDADTTGEMKPPSDSAAPPAEAPAAPDTAVVPAAETPASAPAPVPDAAQTPSEQ